MKLSENKYLLKILDEPTIFISAGNEEIKKDTLDKLLELKLEHLYFISPTNDILNFLNILLMREDFSIIKSTSEISNIKQKNIIACGFELTSSDFNILKNCKKNKIILFMHDLGFFKDSLEKQYPNFSFIEETISEFIKKNTKKAAA